MQISKKQGKWVGKVVHMTKGTEILAIIACAFLIFMQNNLKTLIVEDPVPNLIIPIWVFIAYLLTTKSLPETNPLV
jgi:hypothetical protein